MLSVHGPHTNGLPVTSSANSLAQLDLRWNALHRKAALRLCVALLAIALVGGCSDEPESASTEVPQATSAPVASAPAPAPPPAARTPVATGHVGVAPPACRLIPLEQVEEIVGARVQLQDVSEARKAAMAELACGYRRAGDSGEPLFRLELISSKTWTRADLTPVAYWTESTVDNPKAWEIPDSIGRAYWIPRQRSDNPLVMVQGARGLYTLTPLREGVDALTEDETAALALALLDAE